MHKLEYSQLAPKYSAIKGIQPTSQDIPLYHWLSSCLANILVHTSLHLRFLPPTQCDFNSVSIRYFVPSQSSGYPPFFYFILELLKPPIHYWKLDCVLLDERISKLLCQMVFSLTFQYYLRKVNLTNYTIEKKVVQHFMFFSLYYVFLILRSTKEHVF